MGRVDWEQKQEEGNRGIKWEREGHVGGGGGGGGGGGHREGITCSSTHWFVVSIEYLLLVECPEAVHQIHNAFVGGAL